MKNICKIVVAFAVLYKGICWLISLIGKIYTTHLKEQYENHIKMQNYSINMDDTTDIDISEKELDAMVTDTSKK